MEQRLKETVYMLAEVIGERHLGAYENLVNASDWIYNAFERAGYSPEFQTYNVDGKIVRNVVATLNGGSLSNEILVVGAHYDTVPGSPGADDNASGVAVLLEMARSLANETPRRTIRFVCFANEEWPHFQTETMGSLVYARECRDNRDEVIGMLSLESLGFYSREVGSQRFPGNFGIVGVPDVGDFVAFIGNKSSTPFLDRISDEFRQGTEFPSVALAFDESVRGVGWSDHWAFWKEGYNAVMVTDTAPFRNPNYHEESDSFLTISFPELSEVARGLTKAVMALGSAYADYRETPPEAKP